MTKIENRSSVFHSHNKYMTKIGNRSSVFHSQATSTRLNRSSVNRSPVNRAPVLPQSRDKYTPQLVNKSSVSNYYRYTSKVVNRSPVFHNHTTSTRFS